MNKFEEIVVGVPKRTRDAILSSLPTAPDDLARLLKDRDLEDLLQPSRDGGWGVVEILAHLRDWEEVFLDRLKTVGNEDNPFLPVQDDELWPIERDYRGRNPKTRLTQFRGRRADTVALLKGLDAGEWDRPARHGIVW